MSTVKHSQSISHVEYSKRIRLLEAVAVVADQVRGAAEVASDLAGGGSRGQPVGNTRDTRNTLDRNTVEDKSGNVGSSHGGTADGVGGTVAGVPGGENAGARGKDIENGTVVGVRGNGPVAVNGTDSDGAGSRGRRSVGSVGTIVTGSNGRDNTGAGSRLDSVVEGSRVTTAERHIDD
ncbi:hypothetical protein HG531_001924 [Fusarium graminearum]|nr:hypothetical protein HG531_001924 [Fusarium graminearum]